MEISSSDCKPEEVPLDEGVETERSMSRSDR